MENFHRFHILRFNTEKNESGDYYIDGTTVNNKKMPPLSLSYGDTVEFKLAISNNPNNGLGKKI